MPAETKEQKALRYIREQRLTVVSVGQGGRFRVVATCKGSEGEEYDLGFDARDNEWRCTCPARTPRCAHLIALQFVARKPKPARR